MKSIFTTLLAILLCSSLGQAQESPAPCPPGPQQPTAAPRPFYQSDTSAFAREMTRLDSINTASLEAYRREQRQQPNRYLLILEWDDSTQTLRQRYIDLRSSTPKHKGLPSCQH